MPERRHRCFDRRIEPCHGRRKDYQAGCRCVRCKGANAAYQQSRRLHQAKGEIPPGAYVSGRQMWRQIDKLQAEGFQLAEIARRLGLKRPCLELHHQTVRQRSVLRMQAFYDALMAEGPEL